MITSLLSMFKRRKILNDVTIKTIDGQQYLLVKPLKGTQSEIDKNTLVIPIVDIHAPVELLVERLEYHSISTKEENNDQQQ